MATPKILGVFITYDLLSVNQQYKIRDNNFYICTYKNILGSSDNGDK